MLHIDILNNYTYKTPRLYALNRTTRRSFVRVHTKARAIIIRRLNNRYQYFAVSRVRLAKFHVYFCITTEIDNRILCAIASTEEKKITSNAQDIE